MKKNKAIITILSLVMMVVLAVCCLSGCNDEEVKPDFNKYLEYLNDGSFRQAKTITTALTLTDGDVTVYRSDKVVTINGEQADVAVTETVLGENGSDETNSSSKQIAVSDIGAPINLTAESVVYQSLTDNGFSCIVAVEKATTVIGIDGVTVDGDVTIVCAFDGAKVVSVKYEAVLSSGKLLAVEITLAY